MMKLFMVFCCHSFDVLQDETSQDKMSQDEMVDCGGKTEVGASHLIENGQCSRIVHWDRRVTVLSLSQTTE